MTASRFDMSATSLVEMLGPAAADPLAEPYQASSALQRRHLDELLAHLRGFLVEAGLPDRIGVDDLVEYFEVRRRNPAFQQQWTTPGNLTLWLFLLVRVLEPQVVVESGVLRGSSLFSL